MKHLTLLFAIITLGLIAGCAKAPHVATAALSKPASFTAEAFFVLEFEHDAQGALVHASPYGPTDSEFKALQDEAVKRAGASQRNPAGFTSQFTVQHVKFLGPLGPKGAVIMQPVARNRPAPLGWVLFATDFDAHGQYLGAEMLHGVALATTCQRQARDLIDANHDRIPRGASLLIYCVPVPPLPTATTLPNGDSLL